jgi:hypothetical protein
MSTTPSATSGGTASANILDWNSASEAGFTYFQLKTYIQAYYDAPGTYTWTIFDDSDNNGIVSGTDFATSISVVVGSTGAVATYAAAITAQGGSSSTVTGSAYGSVLKVALTSAAVAAAPDTAGGVKATVSGTGLISRVYNATTAAWVDLGTPVTSYILGADNFDGSGNAYFNVTNANTAVVTVSLSGSGSMATSLTAGSPATVTTAAETGTTAVYVQKGAATGLIQTVTSASGTAGAATASKASTSALTFATTAIGGATVLDSLLVTDTNGVLTGKSGALFNKLVAQGATTCVASATVYCGTFTLTPTWTSTVIGQSFSIGDASATAALVVTSATAAATTLSVYAPTASYRALVGSTQSFTIKAVDQFGLVIANAAVSATIAGRNSTVNVASCITVAGYCSLTYTDASTSTTSMVDTLTFAGATTGATGTVTYSTLAGLGVTTVLATTTQTSATTGADNYSIDPFPVYSGDGVSNGKVTVSITVKDVNGLGIAGVPVAVTVAGAGAAVLSTSKTVYTGATGTATASVYAWLAPTYGTNYVVTATAGGVADTVNTYWAQIDPLSVRTFTAKATGRVITVVASDRFGNPVYAAPFTARITAGDGFFGTGTNIASGTTDATGTLKFITLESPTDLTVSVQAGGSASYGQTDAPATYIDSAEALNVFTDATVGTATTAETYVGGSYAPAGNNTVAVTVTAETTAAQIAADSAAEATDAANAATDAANAAAEAADAATAAAQDAADAVAALSTQVSEMVSALKKQITALTNLVIKIQKKVKA